MDPVFLQALVVAVLGAIGAGLRAWLKTVLTPRRITALMAATRIVVGATEEVGRVAEMTSAEKYTWAESALKEMAQRAGVRLKPEELNTYIHALLHEQRVLDAEDLAFLEGLGLPEAA